MMLQTWIFFDWVDLSYRKLKNIWMILSVCDQLCFPDVEELTPVPLWLLINKLLSALKAQAEERWGLLMQQ